MFAVLQLMVKVIPQRSVLPKVLEACVRTIFNRKSFRNGTIHRENKMTSIATSTENLVRVVALFLAHAA